MRKVSLIKDKTNVFMLNQYKIETKRTKKINIFPYGDA